MNIPAEQDFYVAPPRVVVDPDRCLHRWTEPHFFQDCTDTWFADLCLACGVLVNCASGGRAIRVGA